MEKPDGGGSFIRQKDGTLKRADDIAASAATADETVVLTTVKPPRSARAITKDK